MSSDISFLNKIKRRLFSKCTDWYFDFLSKETEISTHNWSNFLQRYVHDYEILMEKQETHSDPELQKQYFEKLMVLLEELDNNTSYEEKLTNFKNLNTRFFSLLLSEKEPQQAYWDEFRKSFVKNYDQFATSLEKNISPDVKNQLLICMLIPIARSGFLTQTRKKELFFEAQKMGVDILPSHFYSPIPNLTEIEVTSYLDLNPMPLDMNTDVQLETLAKLHPYIQELAEVPEEKAAEGEFYWKNPAFNITDAGTYYSMIRHLKPNKVLEVGAGYSTILANMAAKENGNTTIDVIEPYPMEFLKTSIQHMGKLIDLPLQHVPVETFKKLEEGDILFIDSTHVSKYDSDLNYIIFNLLPALKPGIIIHFHDIYLPYDYPIEFLFEHMIFWNENYLLGAMLLDSDRYEILQGNYFLGKHHLDDLKQAFNPLKIQSGGGSFWMRKVR